MSMNTVLVADDSRSVRETLRGILTDAGYSVTETDNGKDAMHLASTQSFDLVLTDVYLPQIDGIDFISRLRARAEYMSTPILAISNNSLQPVKDKARAAGATGWIKRPILEDELRLLLKRFAA